MLLMSSAPYLQPRNPGPGRILLPILIAALFFALGSLATWWVLRRAEEVPAEPAALPVGDVLPPDAPAGEPFRFTVEEVAGGAATLVGAAAHGGPAGLTEVALIRGGEGQRLWRIQATDHALPLRPEYLAGVVDGTPVAMLPSFRRKDRQGQVPDLAHFNDIEAEAFCEALYKANLASPGAFTNSARLEVTFGDMFNEPKKHRGQVVHFEGRLHRVRRTDAPAMARARGVDHLYEGWLFDARYGLNPVCLVFTELPPGIPVAEKMDRTVAFDGYFFKKYRYHSSDSKPGYARETPLVIGRSPVLVGAGTASGPTTPGWSAPLLIAFLVVLLVTAVVAIGLQLWFRRGDRKVSERLAQVRARDFLDSSGGPSDTTPSVN
jgi:hypothetical protein